MNKINVNQICSISVIIKERNWYYDYKKGWKFLGIVFRKEGFYNWSFGYDDWTDEKDIIKNHNFIENNRVYNNPHLIIKMSNDQAYTIWFDTKEELDNYIESEGLGNNGNIKWLYI